MGCDFYEFPLRPRRPTGSKSKKFSCEENGPWTPTRVVPDCVSEDTTLSTYDVEATITYRSSSPIPDYCADVYAQTVEQYQVRGWGGVEESRHTALDIK